MVNTINNLTKGQRKHVATLERRVAFLQRRLTTRAMSQASQDRDVAELRAVEFALENIKHVYTLKSKQRSLYARVD
jgi:hypothetical protein